MTPTQKRHTRMKLEVLQLLRDRLLASQIDSDLVITITLKKE